MRRIFSSKRLLAAFLSAAVCVAVFILSLVGVRSVTASKPSVPSKGDILILIDPGHGGEDGGAIGVGNLIEKELNLDISLRLRDVLRLMGYRVRMTRETDVSLNGRGSSRKSRDLNARLDAINESDVTLCVSIHQNSYSGSGTARGTQVFHVPDCEKSKLLAECIRHSVKQRLQPENERAVKAADSSIYILKHAKNPAVLVECAFLSDPRDALLLSKEAGKSDFAFAIAGGIAEYLDSPHS